MTYSIERLDDVLVVRLVADVWSTLEGYQVKDEIRVQLTMGARKFVLEFTEVDAVNSLGMGVVVSAWASIRQAGGALCLTGLGPRVDRAFRVTGLVPLLDTSPTLDEALAALRG